MFRYFIRMAYMGTDFNGWQVQPGAPTIQEEIEKCLSLLLKEPVRLTGAGRTDTGVHAHEFYAHFDCSHRPEMLSQIQPVYKSNRFLPPSIAVLDIFPVDSKAHARFHALDRTYHYYICTRKDPFYTGRAWIQERPMDMKAMQEAAGLLLQHEDFSSFARSNTQVKTNICKVYEAHWEEDGHILYFRIRADRFLRNMVRAIVGTMVDIGRGKLGANDFQKIIEAKDRRRAGYSAPACGLFLVKIRYPDHIFNASASF